MYVPRHFEVAEEAEIFSFIDANAFGQLVSIDGGRPYASHLPFLLASDHTRMHCHLARQNPQWQQLADRQVLVTFLGPHDYISPSWYQNDDDAAVAEIVEALSARYESGFETPWQPQYRDAMLKAIIGVEITIDEVQCKYKLSQNRPAADHQGVVDKLDQLGSKPLARAMRKTLF